MHTVIYTPIDTLSTLEREDLVRFLLDHKRLYAGSETAINNALDHAMSPYPLEGGFIIVAKEGERIAGTLVMNNTGMKEYMPQNLLVYLFVDQDYKGCGTELQLLKEARQLAKGSIAVHVKPADDLIPIYEEVGFSKQYIEMRLE